MLSSSEASAFIFLKTNNCRFFGPKNGPQNDRVGRSIHTFKAMDRKTGGPRYSFTRDLTRWFLERAGSVL